MLALPALAWLGAAHEWFLADCDAWDCGDRARAWFLFVLVTGPLIPIGGWLVAPSVRRPGVLARARRLACGLVEGGFGLIGCASAAVATGFTEEGRGPSPDWLILAAFCFAIVFFLDRVRRRLPRT